MGVADDVTTTGDEVVGCGQREGRKCEPQRQNEIMTAIEGGKFICNLEVAMDTERTDGDCDYEYNP
jgi:hypothetical protein